MVFEQLFKFKPIKKNTLNLFVMGFIFSELGILSSLLVFRQGAHLMSIAFTAAISMPFLFSLMEMKNIEIKEKPFCISVFHNSRHIFHAYLLLFLGFFLSYAIFATLLPDFISLELFRRQLLAIFQGNLALIDFSKVAFVAVDFWEILLNNVGVLLVCFFFSVIFGVGSILFLIWNASAWGAGIGLISRQAAIAVGQNPLWFFFKKLVVLFPHLIVEAAAYFFAIIAGVMISQTFINKHVDSKSFQMTMLEGFTLFGIGLVLVIIAALLETFLFPALYGL